MTTRIDIIASNAWRLYPATFAERLSRGKWKRWKYLDVVSDEIAKMVYNGGGILLVSLPVRHGKSEMISHWTPTWFLDRFPDRNVILASYEAGFAASWGRKVRNTASALQDELSFRLAEDSQAAGNWHTDAGGGMQTAGAGGAFTGKGGHLIIIDDPLKNSEEADSETIRAKQIDWFDSTIYTRREPGCVIVLLMARWHKGDLYGHIKNHPSLGTKVKEIRIPAIAEENDPLGRQPGEALCPDRYTITDLHDIKENIQPRWWNALYQQQPGDTEGSEIKRHWWHWYEPADLPQRWDYLISSWDCGFRKTATSDFVVGQVWGAYGPNRYLLDQVRDRMGPAETYNAIAAQRQKWKPLQILIEAKASGDSIIDSFRSEGIGNIVGVDPLGGKESRIRAAATIVMNGTIYLPNHEKFSSELVEEAAEFPLGNNDDQLDAMSQALLYLLYFKTEHSSDVSRGDDKWDTALARNPTGAKTKHEISKLLRWR